MRKSILTLAILVLSFILLQGFNNLKEKPREMFNWYAALLSNSMEFLKEKQNLHFKDSLQVYLDTCKSFDFHKHTRIEPYLCQPLFLNKSHDKVIALVLTRILNLANERSENVYYISGKYEKERWIFKLKTGHVDGFDYVKKHPTISDTEIGFKILGRLIQYGYLKKGEIYSSQLFNSEMYVFRQ